MAAHAPASGRATASGLAAIVLWSTTIALSRRLVEQVGPLGAPAAVFLAGGALGLVRLLGSPTRRRALADLEAPYLLGAGSLFVLYVAMLYLALGLARDRHQAVEIGLLNYLWPTLTILLSLAFLGQKARWLLAPASGLALAGIVLVLGSGSALRWRGVVARLHADPSPYVVGLAAAFAWALHSNVVRRWGARRRGPAVELFVLATGLVLLALRLAVDEPGAWNGRALVEAGALALVTAASYGLRDLAMREGDVVLVAACSNLIPLLSTLASCAYLGIAVSARLWAGCVLIVAGS